jgi:hypothetical protein
MSEDAFEFDEVAQAALDNLNKREEFENYGWKPKGQDKRAKFEITAYIGLNGHGKTLAMVHDTWPSLRDGRLVFSTVPLLHPVTREPHPFYVPLTDWEQLLDPDLERADVLFDEVQGIANSRASQGMPVQVQTLLHQLRKKDLRLRWTAPSWSRADLLLREVTRTVTVCRGYFPERGRGEDGRPLAWGANRLFRWLTYDAGDFTEWTDNKEVNLRGLNNSWFWRPRSLAERLYDTRSVALRVGEVLDAGTCAYCGGHKPRRPCSCDAHTPRPLRRVEPAREESGGSIPEPVTPATLAARLPSPGSGAAYVRLNAPANDESRTG